MKPPRWYIRIPPNSEDGSAEQFIRVDPQTLHIGMLTELYQLDSRTHRYLPHRNLRTVQLSIDVSELLEQWQTLIGQLDAVVDGADGKAWIFVQKLRGALDDFPHFVELLAAGQLNQAQEALNGFGYGLQEMAATAVDTISTLEDQASKHGDLASTMVDMVANQDENAVEAAKQVAQSIREGLSLYGQLSAYRTDLGRLLDLIPQGASWATLDGSDGNINWLREHAYWLNDRDSGFTTRASQYLISPDPERAEDMEIMVLQAQERIAEIKQRLATAQAEHNQAKLRASQVLERELNADPLLRQMYKIRDAVAPAIKYGVHALAITKGFLDQGEFERWQALARDPEWISRFAISAQLKDMASTVRRLIDHAPSLDRQTEANIHAAEGYIEKLESVLRQQGHVVMPDPIIDLNDQADEEEEDDEEAPAPVPAGSVDTDRMQVIYEMMLAVGAHCYCLSKGPLMGTQPKVILEILEILGKISSDERRAYLGTMERILNVHSFNFEEDQSGRSRMAIWEEEDDAQWQWMSFQQRRGRSVNRYWFWRLLKSAYQTGLEMADKYGITADDSITARQLRKEESLERYQNWRARQTSA